MSELAAKLDNLSLGEERSKMFDYIWRAKKNKKFYACKNNYLVVPELKGSSYVLCRKVGHKGDQAYVCLKCTNMTVFENLGNVKNFDGLKKEYCDHAKLCSVLFCEVPIDSQAQDQNEIEVLKKSSEFLVHPVDSLNKTSGVVVIHCRATKPKCHTCQGKKCVHVNIYLDIAKSSKDGEEFPTKTIQNKQKDENISELDPANKDGGKSNVFGVKIHTRQQKKIKFK